MIDAVLMLLLSAECNFTKKEIFAANFSNNPPKTAINLNIPITSFAKLQRAYSSNPLKFNPLSFTGTMRGCNICISYG